MKTKTERRNLLSRKVYRFFLAVRVRGHKKPRIEFPELSHPLAIGTVSDVAGNKEK